MYKLLLLFLCTCHLVNASVTNKEVVYNFEDSAAVELSDSLIIEKINSIPDSNNQSVTIKTDSILSVNPISSRFKKDKNLNPVIKTDSMIFTDTNSLVKQKFQPKPRVAGLLSTFLPGAGQVYNRSYWKPLIIYGGAYFLVDFIVKFSRTKEYYRQVLILHDVDSSSSHIESYTEQYKNIDKVIPYSPALIASLSEAQIQLEYDSYSSNLQNLYIFSVVWYGLNILDAAVDAHLKNFDVSDDLSMKIKPGLLNVNNSFSGIGPSLSLQFSIK